MKTKRIYIAPKMRIVKTMTTKMLCASDGNRKLEMHGYEEAYSTEEAW